MYCAVVYVRIGTVLHDQRRCNVVKYSSITSMAITEFVVVRTLFKRLGSLRHHCHEPVFRNEYFSQSSVTRHSLTKDAWGNETRKFNRTPSKWTVGTGGSHLKKHTQIETSRIPLNKTVEPVVQLSPASPLLVKRCS